MGYMFITSIRSFFEGYNHICINMISIYKNHPQNPYRINIFTPRTKTNDLLIWVGGMLCYGLNLLVGLKF